MDEWDYIISNVIGESRNPSLMRAGFHIPFEWDYNAFKYKCRNPSLMRAGFHKKLIGGGVMDLKNLVSQSLVNEGRFPRDES